MKHSIVIPAFNNAQYTSECIEAILRHTEDFEVILVDNGSTDHTPALGEALATRYPGKVIYKRLDENKGFGAAINVGTRLASGSLITWLNNDALVTPNWATQMERCIEVAPVKVGVPRIGMAGPASNFVGGLQFVPDSQQLQLNKLDEFAKDFHKMNPQNWVFVSFISGFCLMVRREVIEEIGLLDERFPVGGFEDNDFVVRALHAGWPAVIAGDTFIYHYGSRTIDSPPFAEQNRGISNWYIFFDKYRQGLPRHQRLVACYRVKDAAAFLKASLDSAARFTEAAVVMDTGSSDKTIEIAKRHPHVRAVAQWRGEKNERDERNAAINLARELEPDWIISIDADEVFEKAFDREQAQRLMNVPDPQICAYGFHFFTFWDKKNWRQDGIFGSMMGYRMFRNIPHLNIQMGTKEGLHCGNIPTLPIDARRITSFRIKHMGYDTPKIRKKKYEFYSKIDSEPNPLLVGSTSYRHLVSDAVSLRPWNEKCGVSLCMIVKNEDYNLFRFLGQQNGWNEVVMVDTGSNDHSIEVAEAFGVRVVPFEWTDSFADARNAVKAQAKGSWILHLDPDEVLDQSAQMKVRRMIEDPPDGYLVYVSNPQHDGRVVISESIRLFRNLPELKYSGRVHESFDPVLQKRHKDLRMITAPFNIVHQGYLKTPDDVQDKLDNYERLNRLQMRDDPNDPRPYYNLALHMLNEEEYAEGERLLLQAAEKSGQFYQPRKELGLLHLRKAQKHLAACVEVIPKHNPAREQLNQMAQTILGWLGHSDVRVGVPRRGKEGKEEKEVERREVGEKIHVEGV